jgi:Cytochrome P450
MLRRRATSLLSQLIWRKGNSSGDRVVLFAYGAHHKPRFWEAPGEFRPEHWMADAAKKQVKYSYLPFGGGKRSCIGGAMSQVENHARPIAAIAPASGINICVCCERSRLRAR